MRVLVNFALKIRGSLNKLGDYDYVTPMAMGERIPKIVHQTYFTKNLPEKLQNNLDKMKAENPDWEFRLYDDEDIAQFISAHFASLLPVYQRINTKYGAAKADFFRYLVMYKEGGVYLDIKSGLNKPLNSIIHTSDKYVLSHWPRFYPKIMLGQHPGITNPLGELQQWYIIAIPGHPFLKSVIENVCNNIKHYNPLVHDFGSWGVFNLTGPIAYTEAIYPLLSQYPHRLQNNHIDVGLIYVALDSNDSFGGHHQVFQKKHYSKLDEPITTQPFYILWLFNLIKPIIKLLKSLKKP